MGSVKVVLVVSGPDWKAFGLSPDHYEVDNEACACGHPQYLSCPGYLAWWRTAFCRWCDGEGCVVCQSRPTADTGTGGVL